MGARGRAHFKVRTYTKKDGGEGQTNDVEKFYDYDPSAMSAAGWSAAGDEASPWDTGAF